MNTEIPIKLNLKKLILDEADNDAYEYSSPYYHLGGFINCKKGDSLGNASYSTIYCHQIYESESPTPSEL